MAAPGPAKINTHAECFAEMASIRAWLASHQLPRPVYLILWRLIVVTDYHDRLLTAYRADAEAWRKSQGLPLE